MKEGGDSKEWLRKHTVTAVLWTMTPQVVAAYLCVALHATYTGIYIAGCIVYLTVTVAVGGLTLENGIVRFFGSYKAQASPLVILSSALICCASFGILHFAIWSMWPSEYLNMHGIEDALYFSVVTMATVGYGDIVPVTLLVALGDLPHRLGRKPEADSHRRGGLSIIHLPQRQRPQYRPHRLQTAAQQLIQSMAITPGKLQTQSSAHALVISPNTTPAKYLCRLLIYAATALE
jgi:hypothetical protein